MKIKICGLKSLEDISFINEAQVDFAGFIFAKESKRRISLNQAIEMKKSLSENIQSIGVFVNEKIETILDVTNAKVIEIIQLHGNEDNEYINILKSKTDLKIIKAFKADENLKYNIDNTLADFVLIDSYNKNNFGGTGEVFDWGLIPETDKKIFLAGGLNAQNISEAMKETNSYCVDINSGVETDGKKDKNKIFEITKLVKGYKND